MRIGVDIDDVLKPWYSRAHRVCVRAGITNGVTPTTWHPYREYDCPQDVWLEALAPATALGMRHSLYGGMPYRGAVDALLALKSAGHTIHLITARGTGGWPHGELLRETTVKWLAKHRVPHDSLTFSNKKTEVRTDFFVDDNLGYYDRLDAARCKVYLMDRPWNQDDGSRRRVKSLAEFVEVIG